MVRNTGIESSIGAIINTKKDKIMFTLIMGNISFDEDTAKIHSIDFVKGYQFLEDAEKEGEEWVNVYGAYIIPEIFKQTPIIFQFE